MELELLRSNLKIWYHKNKRVLPWRETSDPYQIWLSEIILQQTQVVQGLPYFNRFITKYPKVEDLAAAKEEQILRDWQGLGYYSRARNLHQTAKIISKEYENKFPNTYKKLLQLKGIGPYTAAAISSFAFGEPKAVLDGNVSRVISRLYAIEDPINRSPVQRKLQNLADELMDVKSPGIHNQAMMELGSRICKPKNPKCNKCPFENSCLARKLKLEKQIPSKDKKSKSKQVFHLYIVINHKKGVFMKQRPDKGIWANLFDFPKIELESKLEDLKILESNELSFIRNMSLSLVKITEWKKHVLSHRIIWAKFLVLQPRIDFNPYQIKYLEESTYYSFNQVENLGKPILIVNFLKENIY